MSGDNGIQVLESLSAAQRTALEALGEPVTYPPEYSIFLEGQPSRSVLLIKQGSFKVTQRAVDGTDAVIAIRGAVELMGEEGALLDDVRSSTVTAITEVTGLDIAADKLRAFVAKHDLWPVMYRVAVHRRRQSDRRALVARLDVKGRLAGWFLELAGTELGKQVDDGLLIESTLKQQDIASQIWASKEAVAAALRKFRQDKVVSTGPGRIVLHDLDTLRRISSH